MKIRFLYGPWPFAIVGSLLIVSSTFILGVITFKKEQKLLKVQKKIDVTDYKIQEAQRYYDTANLQVRMAVIQNLVMKDSISKDANQQEKPRKVYVTLLFAELLRLSMASGEPVIEQERVENLRQLSTKASEGDNSALEKLNSFMLEFLRKSHIYREKLITEKDNLEKAEENSGVLLLPGEIGPYFFRFLAWFFC